MTIHKLEQQVSPDFEEFWRLCPRKVDKALAKARWQALTSGGYEARIRDRETGEFVTMHLSATPEELIDGMRRYRGQVCNHLDRPVIEDRFICHPATWLNRGRWMDGE